eukprot:scaffold195743_cov19-Tisochrysis_lutea.AAC.1
MAAVRCCRCHPTDRIAAIATATALVARHRRRATSLRRWRAFGGHRHLPPFLTFHSGRRAPATIPCAQSQPAARGVRQLARKGSRRRALHDGTPGKDEYVHEGGEW